MKSKLLYFLCCFLFLASFFLLFQEVKQKKFINTYKKELQILQSDQERLDNMRKTLVISYGLSFFEAKYYAIIFDDFSKKYNVPWTIYPAVIRVESNFKTTHMSPKGAKGIGQMLEATAKETADKLGIEYKPSETLWNEILNLVLTLTYLSEGIQQEGVENGVKRYLGGPSYAQVEKVNKDAGIYIGAYKTTVWQEYTRLSYIFKGVQVKDPSDSLFSETPKTK